MIKGKNNYQTYNNITFKNETELEFYKICEKAQLDKKIKSFEFETKYELQPEFLDWRDKKMASITHIPDFQILLNDNSFIIVDSKGADAFTHDEVAVIKRKMLMYQNQKFQYYMISKTPKYLGNVWVETSKSYDFLGKLRTTYDKLFPNVNKRLKESPKFGVDKWSAFFEFHDIAGLFYVWDKTYTKKELEKMNK